MHYVEIEQRIKELIKEARECSTQEGLDHRLQRALESLSAAYEREIVRERNETSLNANRGMMAGWICGVCGMVMSPFQSVCCNSPHQKVTSNFST